jgi:hypothetical protein
MPKRELITLNGKSRYGFNIDESVGIMGRNKTGDILLIQAMLQYIANGLGSLEAGVIPISNFKVPKLTGVFDGDTMMSLNLFQSLHSQGLLKVDAIIHPASYAGRNINPFKPVMTITLLHVLCKSSAKSRGHGDYTTGMIRLLPNLLPWIIDKVVHV